jgi:hypothetical protein
MANGQAVGLNEVGGVTLGVNRNLDVQDARSQRSRATADLANQLQAVNYGPAMRTQVSGKLNQASAQNAGANRSAEYDQLKHQAERATVQGHDESTQIQSTSASQAEAAVPSLMRPL